MGSGLEDDPHGLPVEDLSEAGLRQRELSSLLDLTVIFQEAGIKLLVAQIDPQHVLNSGTIRHGQSPLGL